MLPSSKLSHFGVQAHSDERKVTPTKCCTTPCSSSTVCDASTADCRFEVTVPNRFCRIEARTGTDQRQIIIHRSNRNDDKSEVATIQQAVRPEKWGCTYEDQGVFGNATYCWCWDSDYCNSIDFPSLMKQATFVSGSSKIANPFKDKTVDGNNVCENLGEHVPPRCGVASPAPVGVTGITPAANTSDSGDQGEKKGVVKTTTAKPKPESSMIPVIAGIAILGSLLLIGVAAYFVYRHKKRKAATEDSKAEGGTGSGEDDSEDEEDEEE